VVESESSGKDEVKRIDEYSKLKLERVSMRIEKLPEEFEGCVDKHWV
jgi:hypothetical protein